MEGKEPVAKTDPRRYPVVWGRRGVVLETCPRSYITGESLAWVEEYGARRRFGKIDVAELSAREADAFAILENLTAAEVKDGQNSGRRAAR